MFNHKIKKDLIYTSELPFNYESFEIWVREVSQQLDLATPVILPTHYKNFAIFHNAKFRQSDYIDSIDDFDMLLIEDCKQD